MISENIKNNINSFLGVTSTHLRSTDIPLLRTENNQFSIYMTNYIFNGWSSNISATSGSTVGNSAPITQHTTFYATWKQLSKTVTFRFGGPVINNNIIITWNDLSLPDVEFTIKIKDITNNSTFDITIPRNYQSSGYTTNKTFISGHQYQLVSCSPTKVGNTTYQVFTGVAFDM